MKQAATQLQYGYETNVYASLSYIKTSIKFDAREEKS